MLKLAGTKKIDRYQKAHGLKVTGKLDPATRSKVRVHNKNATKVKTKTTTKAAAPADPYASQVKAAVGLKYAPAQQDLQGQIRASDQQQANLHGWYGDYLNAINGAAQRTQQGFADAASQIGASADKSSATDASNRQALIAQMQADAAKRGATVDPSLSTTGAQAEASRHTGLDEAQAATLRTGANQNAYLADRGRVGAAAEVGAHTAESGRRTTLVQKKADLKLQAADYGQQVRQSLADQNFKNQVAAQGLGIKIKQVGIAAQNANTSQKLANSTINNNNADNRRENRKLAEKTTNDGFKQWLDKNKFASAQQVLNYQKAHGLGPFKPPAAKSGKSGPQHHTPAQKQAAKREIRKWEAKVRIVKKQNPHLTEQQVLDQLNSASTSPSDPLIGRAAVQRVYRGGVGGKTRRQLAHNYGIHVPGVPALTHKQVRNTFGI